LREVRELRDKSIMFRVDVKDLCPSIRRKNMFMVIKENIKGIRIIRWRGEGMKGAL